MELDVEINAFACADSILIPVRAAEISAEGVSIYKHDPKGKAAVAYHALTEEVISHE